MKNMKKWELDQRGNTYVEESLKFGLTLSKLFASHCNLSHGHSYTYLPASTPKERIYDFSQGGKIFSPTNEVRDTLSILIADLEDALRANPSLIVVFENPLAKKGDPWLEKRVSGIFYLKDVGEVFHFSTSVKDLAPACRESTTSYGSAVYLMDLKHAAICDGNEVAKDTLDHLSQHVLKVFILNSYDGESFVVWERFQ